MVRFQIICFNHYDDNSNDNSGQINNLQLQQNQLEDSFETEMARLSVPPDDPTIDAPLETVDSRVSAFLARNQHLMVETSDGQQL